MDTTLPVITLTGSGTITQIDGIAYIDAGAIYTDNYDGTGALIGSGTVDTNTPGTYYLTFDFTDTNGNAAVQVTRTINITNGYAPILTLI